MLRHSHERRLQQHLHPGVRVQLRAELLLEHVVVHLRHLRNERVRRLRRHRRHERQRRNHRLRRNFWEQLLQRAYGTGLRRHRCLELRVCVRQQLLHDRVDFELRQLRQRLGMRHMSVRAAVSGRKRIVFELRTGILSLGFAAVLLAAAGCGDDDTEKVAAVTGSGQRGESCRVHADCVPGLACVGKVCSVGAFGLTASGSECVQIECRTAIDCCPEPPAACTSYKQICDSSGDPTYCNLYQTQCVCTEADWGCENDKCVERCTTSSDCSLSNSCVNSKCVECASDDDCGTNFACKDQECVPKCKDSDECEYFHECLEGTCVETGCKTDRECQAASNNVLSVCREKECVTPCASDIECDQPRKYGYSACIDNLCVDIGCVSDEECRILLGVQAGRGTDAACRPITKP